MSYLHYFCLFTYSGVQYILCCVLVLFVFVLCTIMLAVFLDCPYFIAPSGFSNIYLDSLRYGIYCQFRQFLIY